MGKKTLAIVCVVMLVLCYFAYDYQDGKRQEKIEQYAQMQREKEIARQDSLNNLRPMSPYLQAEMERYIEAMSDINLAGYEKLRRLYYLSFTKDGDRDVVTLMTGYGLNRDKIEGYTRLGKNLIIYYGNKQNVSQDVFDESKLLKETELLDYYGSQLENKQDTLFYIQKYVILKQDTASLLQPIR